MTLHRQSALEHEIELSEAPWRREDLFELGNAIAMESQNKNLVVATAMFFHGQCIFQMGLEGTTADNDSWIMRKVNTVELTGHSSLALREKVEALNIQEEDLGFRTSDLAICGGGFPLKTNDVLVGIAVVSGLPHLDDHDLIVEHLRLLKKKRGW